MKNAVKGQKCYLVWTDGACDPNPGIGGWGALIRVGDIERTLCGGTFNTTNNRMEMQAAIEALREIPVGAQVVLASDSRYLVDGMTKWVKAWHRRKWITKDKKPVKNKMLWQQLDKLNRDRNVRWEWVKGHSGHRENDIADQLACEGRHSVIDGSNAYRNVEQPNTACRVPRGARGLKHYSHSPEISIVIEAEKHM